MSIAYLDGRGPVKEFELTEDGLVGCWNCGSMHLFVGFDTDPRYEFLTRAYVECLDCDHRGRSEIICKFAPGKMLCFGDKWDRAIARAKAAWNFECTRMSSFWNLKTPYHYNWGY